LIKVLETGHENKGPVTESGPRNKLKRRPEAEGTNSSTAKKVKQGEEFDEDEASLPHRNCKILQRI